MNSQEYQREYWKKNKDRIIEKRSLRRKETARYMKTYRAENRSRLNEQRKSWMEHHPGKHNEYTTRWREKHPDKQKIHALKYVRKRQTRKLGLFVEDVDPSVLLERFNGCCGICKRPIAKGKGFHIDHIVPLSKGGEHSYGNTQPAHQSCNLKKGAKEIKDIERIAKGSDPEFRVAVPKRSRRTRGHRPK